ncbi:hypothetical protein [Ammonifex thiophilus]|uniref:Uncharacterized protein n=1 Tax=Ammonifex thiophilus TaxID=444093 RepID=A0A3D8P0R2_9THEO|nr:hypothetical protein [Ammonifex thiophilus]RDV80412.1 hypothetical protein DXX99_10925 [Ammonifex thiophilus]
MDHLNGRDGATYLACRLGEAGELALRASEVCRAVVADLRRCWLWEEAKLVEGWAEELADLAVELAGAGPFLRERLQGRRSG